MKMLSITEDGHIMASEPMSLQETSGLLLNVTLGLMRATVENQKDANEQKQATEELYDMFNLQASALLHEFAPEIELRPDLTAEAILKAENALLEATPVAPAVHKPNRAARRKGLKPVE